MQPGEVYWTHFKTHGRHPGIVLRTTGDMAAMVLVSTSPPRDGEQSLSIPVSGLPAACWAKCKEVEVLSLDCIDDYLHELPIETYDQIVDAVLRHRGH